MFDWISIGCAALNTGLVAWWIGWVFTRYRRVRRLEMLLSILCIDAFYKQHLPIWHAWSRAFGYGFQINLVEPSRENEKSVSS